MTQSKIKVATLDIECESENGFPEPTLAEEKVNAITIKPFRHNATNIWYRSHGMNVLANVVYMSV